MKRITHYILFFSTVAVAALCGVMMMHVNVNADMTKYLPDKSQMKRGLEIVTTEFGSSAQMSGSDVHVMFEGMSPKEVPGITTLLEAYPDVRDVGYRFSKDSAHTVFDLDVPKSVDQKALGKQISNRFGGNCVVETSQDGATPPMAVMVIAGVMIMLILFLMAQSWFEPVVILVTTLLAVLLNMGTNALLPSVSITTNFIGSILQAVLSLDYCIVLLNRYRQEQNENTDKKMAVVAANRALRNAAPSILSSAFTTVVGLLMLCFMRLKIGADMGIVLAKGVLCSLICTFTALPSLMMLFRQTINKTAKRAYVPPTDGFARFVTSHKVSMAVCAVLLFFSSWYLSTQTTIFFSAEAESKIEEVFPSPNPFVLVYDTRDEDSIYTLVDSLMAQPGIESVISYPTLMSKRFTPQEMTQHVRSFLTDFRDMMPEGMTVPSEALDMIQPDLVQLVYYMHAKDSTEKQLSFPEVARFLHTHVAQNPLFADFMDAAMREQVETLQSMLDMPAPEPVKPAPKRETKVKEEEPAEDTVVLPRETIAPLTHQPGVLTIAEDTIEVRSLERNKIAVIPFMERLNAQRTSAVSVEMRKLTDTAAIRLPMSVNEMSIFMGSTLFQTRLVYGYAPGNTKKMTPLQYVHLLVDDLFKRKGLAGMVSEEQRMMLGQRAHLMDLADGNASLSAHDLNMLLRAFGVDDLSDDQLLAIAYPKKETPQRVAQQPSELNVEEIVSSLVDIQLSLHSTDTTRAEASMPKPVQVTKKRGMSREDQQAALFTELMFSGKSYTAEQMADKLARLMRLSSVNAEPVTPAQMALLYDYYFSANSGCDTLRMGFEPLLMYICDTLVYDPRLTDLLPDTIYAETRNIKQQLQDGLGQLRKEKHSLLVVLSSLPAESPETYAFVDTLTALADARMPHEHYYVGESVMYAEMRGGFDHEMNVVTLLTILAIFLIVAFTFRSVIVPTILVMTVMTAVYVNVVVAGIVSGQMLYLAYLIVQAILMGATIDYGILFANYYREKRRTMLPSDAVKEAYKGSIRTILTSGLIMVLGPGVMAVFIDDVMISSIVGCLAVGAFVAICLIMTVVPAVLVALDRLVVYGKKNRFTGEQNEAEKAEKAENAENADTEEINTDTEEIKTESGE